MQTSKPFRRPAHGMDRWFLGALQRPYTCTCFIHVSYKYFETFPQDILVYDTNPVPISKMLAFAVPLGKYPKCHLTFYQKTFINPLHLYMRWGTVYRCFYMYGNIPQFGDTFTHHEHVYKHYRGVSVQWKSLLIRKQTLIKSTTRVHAFSTYIDMPFMCRFTTHVEPVCGS